MSDHETREEAATLSTEIQHQLWEREAAGWSVGSQSVWLRLQRPVPINFQANRLVNVLQYFQDVTDVNFNVHWVALKIVGVEMDTPIFNKLTNVPAEQALALVLEHASAACEFNPIGHAVIDGVVHVSTRQALSRQVRQQSYGVRHCLRIMARRYGCTEEEAGMRLGQMVRDTVGEPLDWFANGGIINCVSEYNGRLVVKTAPQNQVHVVRLISSLVDSHDLADLAELPADDSQQIDDTVTAAASEPTATSPLNSKAEGTQKVVRKRSPGRRPDTDPVADARIAAAWGTRQYPTYAECARAIGISETELRRAVDRHRKRSAAGK